MQAEHIKANVAAIQEKIEAACLAAGRSLDDVTLVCVSKSVPPETAALVVDSGVTHLAENRMEKLLEKKAALQAKEPIIWHFVGNLQRRKVKSVINEIDYFHALSSLSLAAEIEKRAEKPIKCFVQVNVSGEESKQGVTPDEAAHFVAQLSAYPKIQVVGLMTMAPIDATDSELLDYFSTLRQLRDVIRDAGHAHAPCRELSMGMSRDFEQAIQAGATFIRVGSAFFE